MPVNGPPASEMSNVSGRRCRAPAPLRVGDGGGAALRAADLDLTVRAHLDARRRIAGAEVDPDGAGRAVVAARALCRRGVHPLRTPRTVPLRRLLCAYLELTWLAPGRKYPKRGTGHSTDPYARSMSLPEPDGWTPPPQAPRGFGGKLRSATLDIGPLRRHRDFRLFFIGQSVTYLGSTVTYVAIPYQTYQLTHSSLVVGLLGAVELVPLLTSALIGGALADAFDRRRMVLLTASSPSRCSRLCCLRTRAGSRCGCCSSWRGSQPPSTGCSGRRSTRSCRGS